MIVEPMDNEDYKEHPESSATEFFESICKNPALENAWLEALSYMETLAAEQILGNISRHTPEAFRREIETHAADEFRHAQEILDMRSDVGADGNTSRVFCNLGESFVRGYFGNPELIQAKNRHTAYAHGAVTIEQFPYQIYTTYLRYTKNPKVKSQMPKIIQEEAGHLALGRRMLNEIPTVARLSLSRLMQVERSMCSIFLDKCARAILADLKFGATALNKALQNPLFAVAWIETLADSEKTPERASQLREAVLLQKWQMRHNPDYVRIQKICRKLYQKYRSQLRDHVSLQLNQQAPRSEAFSEAFSEALEPALQRRLHQHYQDLAKCHPSILVCHVLQSLLEVKGQ